MAYEKAWVIGIFVVLISSHFPQFVDGQLTDQQEVKALEAIRSRLQDPFKKLRNWKKTDPCISNWTGVICSKDTTDGYYHIQELRLLNKNLSGILAPELGQLTRMTILDFMWNRISGSIPKEIGKITSLQLLLLSGNLISGPLPDELGFLPNLTKFQLDLNFISGPIPKSFANLTNVKHFHMNNNSFSGQIPPELSSLPQLVHFLLDNNNLSGYLPPELAKMPNLKILQLDNNNFDGTEIPASYGNISTLLKLSLRNCKLTGSVPDVSGMRRLNYLDLSQNQLSGNIPPSNLFRKVTTFDLSNNTLNGSIPDIFSGLIQFQRLPNFLGTPVEEEEKEEEEQENNEDCGYESDKFGSPSHGSVLKVGRLVDEYLAEIASDPYISLQKFVSVVEVLPDYARVIDDGLYRAVDIYLKAHPMLPKQDCKKLCKLIDCQKLSQEACNHAAQNDRLPAQMAVRVLYFEQVRLKNSLSFGSGDAFLSQKISSNIPSAAMSPRDNYASLRRENRELKLEISRMRVRLTELEKEQVVMKQGMMEKTGNGKNFLSSLSKGIGRIGIFNGPGVGKKAKGDGKRGRSQRFSVS